jgi:predicted ATP-grasp superfamily ATP-dependent carboligase
MKIFVHEHVTGGGMARVVPPPRLLHEADLMVRMLLADLSTCAGIELLTTRDTRLAPLDGIETIPVGADDDLSGVVLGGIDASEAVWPTAPETGGILAQLAALTLGRGRNLLGSRPDAVQLTSSKLATARALSAAGIVAVPTFASSDKLPATPGRWVTKPDDGAGADGVRLERDCQDARDRLAANPALVAQPWIEGAAASLSLLCKEGEGVLLSCNRQQLHHAGDSIVLTGIAVNALADIDGTLARLGSSIAAAVPGLWGYVGVDLVVTDRGPVVLEINPRLTTSYCGLSQAIGHSVAARVLELLNPGALRRSRPSSPGSLVQLTLEAGCAH